MKIQINVFKMNPHSIKSFKFQIFADGQTLKQQ